MCVCVNEKKFRLSKFLMFSLNGANCFIIFVLLPAEMSNFDTHRSGFCGSGLTASHRLIFFVRVQLSGWSVVLLTSERVISVWFPLKCKELCSRRRIIGVWIGIFVTLIVLNSHFFVTHGLSTVSKSGTNNTEYINQCIVFSQYKYFWVQHWYWIMATVASFIPFGILFLGNIVIVSRIVISNRLRKRQMQAAGAKNEMAKGSKVDKRLEDLLNIALFLTFFCTSSQDRLPPTGIPKLWIAVMPVSNYGRKLFLNSIFLQNCEIRPFMLLLLFHRMGLGRKCCHSYLDLWIG